MHPFRVSDVHKLEDPERLQWLPPRDVIESLRLQPHMVVADIGAGTGYFAIPISRKARRVFAIDCQPEMLHLLRQKLGEASNIELIEADARATTLPDHSCDVAFLATVWHELEGRDQVLKEMRRILKPSGGILAILDWRHDVERPPGPPIEHRIPMMKVVTELEKHNWWVGPFTNVGRFTYLVQAVAPK